MVAKTLLFIFGAFLGMVFTGFGRVSKKADDAYAEYMSINEIINSRWIPCSKRNPDLNDIAGNGCAFFFATEKYQSTTQRRFYNLKEEKWYTEPNGKPIEVIAWQPLFAPYRPKEDV